MKDVFDKFDSGKVEMGEYSKAATAAQELDVAEDAGLDLPVSELNQDGTVKNPRRPGAFTSDQPSPYERAGGLTSAAAVEQAASKDALHNDRNPYYEIKHQKPEHRVVILLKAKGCTNKEIAQTTGLSAVSVSNILRQPWARKQVLEEINSAGRNEVLQIFKGAAMDVAEQMVAIVNDENARPSDKISAGHLILDRLFGKATQPLDVSITDSKLKTMSDEELFKLATGNGSN